MVHAVLLHGGMQRPQAGATDKTRTSAWFGGPSFDRGVCADEVLDALGRCVGGAGGWRLGGCALPMHFSA